MIEWLLKFTLGVNQFTDLALERSSAHEPKGQPRVRTAATVDRIPSDFSRHQFLFSVLPQGHKATASTIRLQWARSTGFEIESAESNQRTHVFDDWQIESMCESRASKFYDLGGCSAHDFCGNQRCDSSQCVYIQMFKGINGDNDNNQEPVITIRCVSCKFLWKEDEMEGGRSAAGSFVYTDDAGTKGHLVVTLAHPDVRRCLLSHLTS